MIYLNTCQIFMTHYFREPFCETAVLQIQRSCAQSIKIYVRNSLNKPKLF